MRLYGLALSLLAAALLAGCSSHKDESSYGDLPQAAAQPETGMAQLVFYYPDESMWSDKVADITVGDKKFYGLESGSFFIENVQPGTKTAIKVTPCGGIHPSHLKINARADNRYFIRITPLDNSVAGDISAKYFSDATPIAPGNSSSDGVYTIDLVDEPSAVTQLQKLKLCKLCF